MNANYEATSFDELLVDVAENAAEDNVVSAGYQRLKRFFDVLCSFIGIIVFSPTFILSSILIRATSKGPAIYRQKRVGLKGELFTIYKFRTMVDGADKLITKLSPKQRKEYENNYKITKDPRITPVGNLLRKSSIDELPQLFNILKGDMSIVGPRPIVDNEIVKYGSNFGTCFSVKPGLTGMWQVSGRSNTTYEERVILDLKYVNEMSILNDLKIIFKTSFTVLTKSGAK